MQQIFSGEFIISLMCLFASFRNAGLMKNTKSYKQEAMIANRTDPPAYICDLMNTLINQNYKQYRIPDLRVWHFLFTSLTAQILHALTGVPYCFLVHSQIAHHASNMNRLEVEP